jgi:predicted alpha/beta-hydrolase family hydrolase
MPGVRGIAFFGFPLHPAGKPSVERAEHLARVRCPMLFLQGTRDELAELTLVRAVVADLDERATLRVFDDADHSFHVRAKSGTSDVAVRQAMIEAIVTWMRGIALRDTD